HTAADLLR
nr:RecName: Full=Putative mandelonitrile lyase [Taxus baccata]